MNATLRLCAILTCVLTLCCCKRQGAGIDGSPDYQPRYARGFEILRSDDGVGVVTLHPWQGADSASARVFRVGDAPQRVVCMSSTHVAMLERLGIADRIVGVSGLDRLSSQTVKSMSPQPKEVGYDGNIDYETLQSLRPDLVMLYGLSSPNPMEERLRQLGIPCVYISEYLEPTPLGKAEWLVAVGEIFGLRSEAETLFHPLAEHYNALRDSLEGAQNEEAVVMLNSPYGGTWMFPSMDSYAARQLQDAGGKPAYDKITGTASMPIDLEQAFLLAREADVWLSPGQITTIGELNAQLPRFANVRAVKGGRVWNTIPDYWESGVVNPDLVLRDLINILHPGVLADTTMTYYYRLR